MPYPRNAENPVNDHITLSQRPQRPVQPAGRLERHFNWVNDQKWNWMPFLSLRPEPSDYITRGVLLTFATFVFGPISILGGVFIFFVATQSLGLWLEVSIWLSILGFAASLTTGVTHQYVCFHFWNRRAFRLRSQPGFRPPVADASSISSHTDSPYRPPESGTAPATADLSSPPLPLRHVLTLLETAFVHGSLLALAVAPVSFWYALGVRGWPDAWQNGLRAAPLLLAVILVAGIWLLESNLPNSVRWTALALRTLVSLGLMGLGLFALAGSALLSSAIGSGTLSICAVVLCVMGVAVLLHCLIQSARLFDRPASADRSARVSAFSVPLMADGERT